MYKIAAKYFGITDLVGVRLYIVVKDRKRIRMNIIFCIISAGIIMFKTDRVRFKGRDDADESLADEIMCSMS